MKAQHTPGPWRIVETTHPVMISTWHIAIGQKEISLFPYKYHFADEAKTCGGYVADAEMHANARLIAAAPELLEALIAAEKKLLALEHMVGGGDGEICIETEILMARAAIAKATGSGAARDEGGL